MSVRPHRIALYCFALSTSFCTPKAHIVNVETSQYQFNAADNTSEDSLIARDIHPYKTKLDAIMNDVLAYSEQSMDKDQPEGLLGDFVTDACLQKAGDYYKPADNHKIDFCFVNNGGLRAALPKGNLIKGKIFELMPFDNELIVVTLDGKKTKMLLDFIAAKGGMPVSGVKIGIKKNKAVNVLIGGQLFDSTLTYKILTSDYLANGGDNLSFLAETNEKEIIGLRARDAIIEYLQEQTRQGNKIKIQLDGRIYRE